MEINSVNAFLAYYDRTRAATKKVFQVIPPDKIDWRYLPNKFSIGDLVRHIAAIERWVFAEVVQGNKPAYKGCGPELADGYEAVMAYFESMEQASVQMFKNLTDADLKKQIKSLDGTTVTLGNFLRALFLHEIHHRAALCIYLNLLGVETPPIIGLREEQVIELSK